MTQAQKNQFSRSVSDLHGNVLPEPAILAGYSALIAAFDLKVPLPKTMSAIGKRHTSYVKGGWQIKTPKHLPDATLDAQLIFALKYEGLDLLVLKRLFEVTGSEPIIVMIKSKPTSSYNRRIWFLYEWLLGVYLDLPDATTGNYITALK